jgi:hypothetical protein
MREMTIASEAIWLGAGRIFLRICKVPGGFANPTAATAWRVHLKTIHRIHRCIATTSQLSAWNLEHDPPALEETGLTAALFDRPDSGSHASQKRFEIAVKTIPERLEKENVRTRNRSVMSAMSVMSFRVHKATETDLFLVRLKTLWSSLEAWPWREANPDCPHWNWKLFPHPPSGGKNLIFPKVRIHKVQWCIYGVYMVLNNIILCVYIYICMIHI